MFRRSWRSRPVVWIRTCAELYGIVGLVAAVSGSVVLTGVVWAAAEVFTNLSVVPKALISIGVFGLALAMSLGLLKYILKQRTLSRRRAESATNSKIYIKRWQDLEQEKEEFRAKYQKSEQEREKLEKELEEARSADKVEEPAVKRGNPAEVVNRLRAGVDELESRGLRRDIISKRQIRYHSTPVRLTDLLEVAGENGAILGFTFEHCILEGPGIITFGGSPPDTARGTGSGGTGRLMVGPTSVAWKGRRKRPSMRLNLAVRG